MSTEEVLYGTTEVARALRLSRQRVLVLARNRRIPGAQRLHGYWIFRAPFRILPPPSRD
jgi:hypothetical protein